MLIKLFCNRTPFVDQFTFHIQGRRDIHWDMWRLNVAAFGLAEAAVNLYTTIFRKLKQVGMKECSIFLCPFYATDQQDDNMGLPSLHVEDMMFAGTEVFHDKKESLARNEHRTRE